MQEPSNMNDSGLVAGMMDFGFNRFITLKVIKVLYVLGLVLIALILLGALAGAISQGAAPFIGVLVVGTVFAAVYAIFWRVSLELIVVMFRIGENTSKLVGAQGLSPAEAPAADAGA